MKRFFTSNPTGAVIAIILFLALCVFGLVQSADATESESRVGIGTGIITQRFGGSLSAKWQEVFEEKWAVNMFFVGEQNYHFNNGNTLLMDSNFGFGLQRVVPLAERWEVGFGAFYWQNTNRALGCKMTAHLSAAYKLGRDWMFQYDHWSNGGSCSPNSGQDSLQFVRRFKFGR